MKTEYRVEYVETEQTFINMYQMFLLNKANFSYKMSIGVACLVIAMIQYSIDAQTVLNPTYWVRFVVFVAIAYVIGYYSNKTFLRKMNLSNAVKTGQAQFEERKKRCGTNLKVILSFYENKFTCTFQGNTEEYLYENVTRLYEMDDLFSVVVGSLRNNQKKMVGIPKSALDAAGVEELRQYLQGKCPQIGKGFQAV